MPLSIFILTCVDLKGRPNPIQPDLLWCLLCSAT